AVDDIAGQWLSRDPQADQCDQQDQRQPDQNTLQPPETPGRADGRCNLLVRTLHPDITPSAWACVIAVPKRARQSHEARRQFPTPALCCRPQGGHAMREDDQDRSNDNAGHRARLRDRLLGGGGLLDHELIEYLLTTAIPRRDTKPIAKALLREFHDIGGVLTADPIALRRVDGVGETAAAALKIAHACA